MNTQTKMLLPNKLSKIITLNNSPEKRSILIRLRRCRRRLPPPYIKTIVSIKVSYAPSTKKKLEESKILFRELETCNLITLLRLNK